MDFSLSEEQVAIADLAAQIFTGKVDADRVAEIEATDDRFDRDLWRELAASNLLGVAIDEAHGGLGFGMVELGLVLEQQGRTVAPVPLVPTLVYGAVPLGLFGTPDQQARWLPAVIAGEVVLTGAYAEYGANDPFTSSVTATPHGDGWRLDGAKPAVPAMAVADAVLVPAVAPEGLAVFCVDAGADGLAVELAETTNRELHGALTFDSVAVGSDAVIGAVGDGARVVGATVDRAVIATSAIVLGAASEALRMAADYTSQREQFGRPLSTNQGVALRAADSYIDVETIRVSMLQAAWRLDAGLPAADALEVAKYWAAEAGQRSVHNTQHLHGGMGADIDYPVHRYFLWVKQIENNHGGSSTHLASLGARIASSAKAAAGTS